MAAINRLHLIWMAGETWWLWQNKRYYRPWAKKYFVQKDKICLMTLSDKFVSFKYGFLKWKDNREELATKISLPANTGKARGKMVGFISMMFTELFLNRFFLVMHKKQYFSVCFRIIDTHWNIMISWLEVLYKIKWKETNFPLILYSYPMFKYCK